MQSLGGIGEFLDYRVVFRQSGQDRRGGFGSIRRARVVNFRVSSFSFGSRLFSPRNQIDPVPNSPAAFEGNGWKVLGDTHGLITRVDVSPGLCSRNKIE